MVKPRRIGVLGLEADLKQLCERRAELEAHRQRAAAEFESANTQRRELLRVGNVDPNLIGAVDSCIATAEMALRGIAEAIDDIGLSIAAHEAELASERRKRGREHAAQESEAIAARLAATLASFNPPARALTKVLAEAEFDQRATQALGHICGQITVATNSIIAELRVYAAQLRTAKPKAQPAAHV